MKNRNSQHKTFSEVRVWKINHFNVIDFLKSCLQVLQKPKLSCELSVTVQLLWTLKFINL